jgi:hypothetical protein
MATNQDLPATDSAAVLHKLVGDDATAAFESDPTFIDSNPGDDSSSNNLQTRADREDIRNQSDLNTRSTTDDDDEDLDDEDEDDLDDDEDEDDEDLDDEDEDDEDLDDEDEDDEEYEDEDDDEDDEDEDEDDE